MVKVIMDVSALKDQKKGIVLQSTVSPPPLAALSTNAYVILWTVILIASLPSRKKGIVLQSTIPALAAFSTSACVTLCTVILT